MKVQLTNSILVNVDSAEKHLAIEFYKALGLKLEEGEAGDGHFTQSSLGKMPLKCSIESFEPSPFDRSEVALQLESDNIEAIKKKIVDLCEDFSIQPQLRGEDGFWFRDPVGNLVNVIPMKPL